jgi:hypothetical protein
MADRVLGKDDQTKLPFQLESAHIAHYPSDRYAVYIRLSLCLTQHHWRQIDARRIESGLRQGDQDRARAASEIEDRTSHFPGLLRPERRANPITGEHEIITASVTIDPASIDSHHVHLRPQG